MQTQGEANGKLKRRSTISIQLDLDTIEQIEYYAGRYRSKSSFVREILEREMDKMKEAERRSKS